MAKNKLIDELSALIGLQNAIVLTRRYGGRTLTIPSPEKLHDKHSLVLTIGHAPAHALAKEYAGDMLNLPLEVNALLEIRNSEIVRLFVDEESSIRGLSIDFGLDRAMIQKIIDKAGHKELRLSRSVTA